MKRMKKEYRRVKMFLSAALLLFVLGLPGTALGEYGYTSVFMIPMAEDFTFLVDIDERDEPHLETDYPFEKAGADAMTVVYRNWRSEEAAALTYHYPAGNVTCTFYDDLFVSDRDVCRQIRNKSITPQGRIYIHTENENEQNDWFLVYSLDEGQFVEYTEKTFSQGFNGMGECGLRRSIFYEDGAVSSMYMDKRTPAGDLVLEYDAWGDIIYGTVYHFNPEWETFDLNLYSGLFGNKAITELGFEKADLEIPTLAALGGAPEVPVPVMEAPAGEPEPDTGHFRILGGLTVGLAIGVTGYYIFRIKKEKAKG